MRSSCPETEPIHGEVPGLQSYEGILQTGHRHVDRPETLPRHGGEGFRVVRHLRTLAAGSLVPHLSGMKRARSLGSGVVVLFSPGGTRSVR